MSVCSTSGRPFLSASVPCEVHLQRSSFVSERRHAALASSKRLLPADLCTSLAPCGQLSRKERRKLTRIVARAQPKGVQLEGTSQPCLPEKLALFLHPRLYAFCQPLSTCIVVSCIGLSEKLCCTAAPPLSQVAERKGKSKKESKRSTPLPRPSPFKVAWNRTLRQLSSLPLAIGELAVIALLSAVGTVIEQNRSLAYYMKVLHFPLNLSSALDDKAVDQCRDRSVDRRRAQDSSLKCPCDVHAELSRWAQQGARLCGLAAHQGPAVGPHLHSQLLCGADGPPGCLPGCLHLHPTVAHGQSGPQVRTPIGTEPIC